MLYDHCPAYSFGNIPKGEKVSVQKSYSPGPGQYYPTNYTKKNPPGFKMGSGARGDTSKPKTPGVGMYNIPSTFPQGPKYTMKGPNGGVEISKTNCSPGPGVYNPLIRSSAPAYSLRGRPNYTPYNAKNPGPGDYDLRTNKSLVVPSYKFGSEPKGSLSNMGNPSNLPKWNEDPGPGNYSPNPDALKTSQPKFSFCHEPRGDNRKNKGPGPGNYNYKPAFGNEGPCPSMHGAPTNPLSRSCRNFETTPGPGMYNSTMYNRPNCPGFKMGKSSRDMPNNAIKRGTPGPGEYSFDKSLNKTLANAPRWGMGSGTSTQMDPRIKNRDCSPGPGKYNISENMGRGPKYSLGGKNFPSTKWKDSVPGPGNYNSGTTVLLKTNPGWKIGTEERGDNLKGAFKNDFPGPDMYNTRGTFSGPGYKFGKSARMGDDKNKIAGPGSYRIPCSIVDVNDYTRAAGKFDPQFRYV